MQNCLQLSTYYNSVNAFALAQYCLAAASALAEQHRSKDEGQVSGDGLRKKGRLGGGWGREKGKGAKGPA